MFDDLDTSSPIDLANPVNRHHPLNRNRVAWWLTVPGLSGGRFIYDLMGLNHGTLTNMGSGSGWAPTTRPGGHGHLKFDGTDDYVSVPNPRESASTLSAFVWVKTTDSNGKYLFAHYDTGANQREWAILLSETGIGASGNSLEVVLTSNGSFASGKIYYGATAINDGLWHRVGFVWNAGTLTLYVDGRVETPTKNRDDSFSSMTNSTAAVTLGARLNSGAVAAPAVASLDDAALWSRALAAAEVFADYELSRRGYPSVINRWSMPVFRSAGYAYSEIF